MFDRSRSLILFAVVWSVACGPALEKGPKKGTANNNTSTNNTSTNNTSTNDTTNNTTTTTNNTVANNTTMTNGQPCVGVEPASVAFGNVTVGEQATAEVQLANCSTTVPFTIDGAAADDGFEITTPSPTAIAPGSTVTATIAFTPLAERDYSGQATLVTSAGTTTVNLTGTGVSVTATCPMAVAKARVAAADPWVTSVTTTMGETVMLTAAESTADEPILTYEWTIVSRPSGSTARLTPNATIENPTLFLDAAGDYQLDLRLGTANSPGNCPTAQVTVTAEPGADPDALVVTLTWDTPSDPDQTDANGTDVDLHYKVEGKAWNAAPYDCYWFNPDANWGADGTAKVDLDDVTGAGPEQITHSNPAAAGTYSIGVHYYAANGYGVSNATVQIHQAGVLLLEKQKGGLTMNQFWYVGDWAMSLSSLIVNDGVTDGFPP